MNDANEIQRLTKAIANLAAIPLDTTAAAVRAQELPAGSIAAVLSEPIRPWMDKKDVAAHLKLSIRTVDNMIRDQ